MTAAVVALALLVSPPLAVADDAVSVPGEAVICRVEPGVVPAPGDELECALSVGRSDAWPLPIRRAPAPLWARSEDAPARESWVCTHDGQTDSFTSLRCAW